MQNAPDCTAVALGTALRVARERSSLSVAEMAQLMGVSRQAVWRYETGKAPVTRRMERRAWEALAGRAAS